MSIFRQKVSERMSTIISGTKYIEKLQNVVITFLYCNTPVECTVIDENYLIGQDRTRDSFNIFKGCVQSYDFLVSEKLFNGQDSFCTVNLPYKIFYLRDEY